MILITGSSGLVGSALRMSLPNSIGLDRIPSSTTDFVLDLLDKNSLFNISQPVDCIVHLAGVQYDKTIPPSRSRKYFLPNILMAHNVIDYANYIGASRIIYVSTDMVYGLAQTSFIDEKSETAPIGHYGRSKLQAENLFLDDFVGKSVILRPRLILGRGRLGTIKKLAFVIKYLKVVPIIGAGNNVYQFVSVKDICQAIEIVIESETNDQIFNVGSNNPPTLNSLFLDLSVYFKFKPKIVHFSAGMTQRILQILETLNISPLNYEQFMLASRDIKLDTSRLASLGWKPEVDDFSALFESLFHIVPEIFRN